MQFSFTTHHSPNIFLNQTISVKKQTIGLKTCKWLRVEVIACGISWSELQRAWLVNKKATQYRGSLFWPWYFQEVLHTYGITLAMNFDFPRISKTNLGTPVEYLQRHFHNYPASFLFGTDHWSTDRPSSLGTEIPTLLHCPRASSWTSPK